MFSLWQGRGGGFEVLNFVFPFIKKELGYGLWVSQPLGVYTAPGSVRVPGSVHRVSEHLGLSQSLWMSQPLLPVGVCGAGAALSAQSDFKSGTHCSFCVEIALTFVLWLLLCSGPSLIYWSMLSFLLTRYSILVYKSLKLAKGTTIILWYKLGLQIAGRL